MKKSIQIVIGSLIIIAAIILSDFFDNLLYENNTFSTVYVIATTVVFPVVWFLVAARFFIKNRIKENKLLFGYFVLLLLIYTGLVIALVFGFLIFS